MLGIMKDGFVELFPLLLSFRSDQTYNSFTFEAMPQFILKIKADLENIKQLIPIPDNEWQLDIQSTDGELQ